jgi:hypothetical protein
MRLSWKGVMRASAMTLVTAAVAPCLLASAALAQANNPADILTNEDAARFTFTFRPTGEPGSSMWLMGDTPSLELPTVGKWRFTLDLSHSQSDQRVPFDSLRAGAFFDLTPRMRVGGALSFSGENDAIVRASGGQVDRDVPEVKFESAFKF